MTIMINTRSTAVKSIVTKLEIKEEDYRVTAEPKEYIVEEWDETHSKVTAYKIKGDKVIMIYEDGTAHEVAELYFEDIALKALITIQKNKLATK